MATLRRGPRTSVPISSGNVMNGVRFFLPTANVNYINPDWDKTKDPTIGKIVPCIDDSMGRKQFLPYRHSEGADGFNDWFAPLPCATYVGTGQDKQSFILYDPLDESYDQASNPYIHMYSTIRRLSKEKRIIKTSFRSEVSTQEFVALFPNSTNRDSVAFSAPSKKITFLNFIPLMSRDKIQVNESTRRLRGCSNGDTPTIIGLSPSAAKTLIDVACAESEQYDPDVLESRFLHGDFTSGEASKWAVIYNDRKFAPDAYTPEGYKRHTNQAMSDTYEEASFDADRKSGDSFAKYGITFSREVMAPRADGKGVAKYDVTKLVDAYSSDILNVYQPIGTYFNVPSNDEIVKYLTIAFSDCPHLLEIGLMDGGFMTDEVWGSLRNRTQHRGGRPEEAMAESPYAPPPTQMRGQTQRQQPAQDVDAALDDPFGAPNDDAFGIGTGAGSAIEDVEEDVTETSVEELDEGFTDDIDSQVASLSRSMNAQINNTKVAKAPAGQTRAASAPKPAPTKPAQKRRASVQIEDDSADGLPF